jgi:hypothetical protein
MAGSFAVNSVPYDNAALELTLDDLVIVGRRGLSFEHGFEVEKLFGATREAIARTPGVHNVEDVEVTMYQSDYFSLIAKFGNGYMSEDKKFSGMLTYSYTNEQIHTVEFIGMRIITDAHDIQQGPEGIEVTVTCSVMRLKIDGFDPVNTASV